MTGRTGAATYEITFRGALTPALRSAFGDLEVVRDRPDTVLRGVLGDQAALQGVLQRLSRLGLELVEVRECSPPSGTSGPPREGQGHAG